MCSGMLVLIFSSINFSVYDEADQQEIVVRFQPTGSQPAYPLLGSCSSEELNHFFSGTNPIEDLGLFPSDRMAV